MNSLALIGLCVLGAFEVTVSPDQPLPYSYTDDPLIVELRSDQEGTANVHITATPTGTHEPVEATFEALTLGPQLNRWYALKEIGSVRGPWTLSIQITMDGVEENLTDTAYRIDRPHDTFQHALYAYGDAFDRNTLLALRSVALDTIQLPLSHPDLKTTLDTLRALEMKAILLVSRRNEDGDQIQAIAGEYCDVLAGWQVSFSRFQNTHPAFTATLETLRGLACQRPVHVRISDTSLTESDRAMLASAQRLVVEYDADSYVPLREALAAQGMSVLPIDTVIPADTINQPDTFLPQLFEANARGAEAAAFPVELVYADGALQPGLSRLNTMAQRVAPGAYAGRIPQPGTTRLQVFSVGDHWRATTWRTDDSSTIELPYSPAHPFSLMDEWGNGIKSEPGEKTWTHPLSTNFLYITGLGGPVLRTALINRARLEAKRALDDDALAPAWNDTLRATLTTIANDPADISSRVQFFSLLRAFPEIEERWHAGLLTRPVATEALARAATLARTLCRLESALGASFLEPLQDTLARCEAFQSAYLTGATTTPLARQRGDWIVSEVRRLMDEAEALGNFDRRIEADAVAALAEWRARALEHAVKAGPLSNQLTLPTAQVEEKETEEEAPKKTTRKKK